MVSVDSMMRNILQQLQQEPGRYRWFGVFWWPIKALLKERYTQDNLYLLGDYVDPDAPVLELEASALLTEAIEEYRRNAAYSTNPNQVQDMDGQAYYLFDEDAGL